MNKGCKAPGCQNCRRSALHYDMDSHMPDRLRCSMDLRHLDQVAALAAHNLVYLVWDLFVSQAVHLLQLCDYATSKQVVGA